jgi:hypothetical protein
VQQVQLDKEERQQNDYDDKEEFGKEQLPPIVGLGDPPLAVTYESFALHYANNHETPKKEQDRGDSAL